MPDDEDAVTLVTVLRVGHLDTAVRVGVQNAPLETLELPGLSLSFPEAEVRTSMFDLTLSLTASEDALVGRIEYCTDLFDSVTVRRLRTRYELLLSELTAHPRRPVSH